jgi:signal transduction histidine kinase/CheY-like chemotaxis protein
MNGTGRWRSIISNSTFPLLLFLCVFLMATLMGSALSSLLSQSVTEWEWENTAAFSRREAEQIGLQTLFGADQTPETRARWSRELAQRFSGLPELVRVKVWDRDATVLWSDEAGLIGQRFPDNPRLREALNGRVSVGIVRIPRPEPTDERGPHDTVAEVYVPIFSKHGHHVVGVVETYKVPSRLYATIRRGRIIIWTISLAGGLVLALILLPLLRQAFKNKVAQARRLEHEAYARTLEQEVAERTRDLAQVQSQLVQAQKMEAIGRLAGGIAHDFNNLLTVIAGQGEKLLDRLPPGDGLQEVHLIQKTAERAATLTQQLLAFSRKQILQPRELHLNVVVAELLPMLRRVVSEDIELLPELDPASGYVKADPGQLQQVIMNLTVNARDAMPNGGKLFLTARDVEVDEGYARLHPGVQPGPYVMLSVRDTGNGMDPNTQAHIFEPFFTTKDHGKGTGLGLATVHGIIEQSGGHISVQSERGRGATFNVYLPRIRPAVRKPEVDRPPAAAAVGSETILLVEDEDDLRDLVREVLEARGYTLLSARNPIEALALADEHPSRIDLLLTDVVMPRMNGRELAERLAPARPGMKILYMSGYTDDAIGHLGVLDSGTAFLSKPFTTKTLAAKVREVLDAPAPKPALSTLTN